MIESLIRTVIPFLVSVVIGQAARFGLGLDPGTTTQAVTGVVFVVYYALARWLEENGHGQVARLMLSLGATGKSPSYQEQPAPTDTRPMPM